MPITAPSTDARRTIESGDATLGIEFGSTRIKALLIDQSGAILASGSHAWENSFVDGLWTYSEDAIWRGLQAAYAQLAETVHANYGVPLRTLGAVGISAMMHGYIALDGAGQLLVPFRTWRNTSTGAAVEELSPALSFNVPHRWSVAHLYQAVLDKEEHVAQLARITTLAGLVHERLSGTTVLGIGDASGMFPIDSQTHDYDARRLQILQDMLAGHGFDRPVKDMLPRVALAGEEAGTLSAAGAALLDPSGTLTAGARMCPPEGDAGTGMVATHSVAARTGNVSAGTSIFAMVVLDKDLERVHPELDLVTTPDGSPVAMVHSNNGTSEWDQWVGVFAELLSATGASVSRSDLYDVAYAQALSGDVDGGGLLAYNFLSGEPVLGVESGRPLFLRTPDAAITLPNFLRTQLMSIFGVLRQGMDILLVDEKVTLDTLYAHGGLFKTPVVAQRIMAAALNTPVAVAANAGEGGPWGIALLALFGKEFAREMSLPEFLDSVVFAGEETHSIAPDPEDAAGFNAFLARYLRALPAERAAAENS